MLLDVVLLRAVRTWYTGRFSRAHVTDTCDEGVDFLPYFYGFFLPPPLRS